MRRYSTDAGKWMAENGHAWGEPKQPLGGKDAKKNSSKIARVRRAKVLGRRISKFDTVKGFVEQNRDHRGHDCLCVPAAQKDVPASVEFCGNHISAARYMLLLTQGTPNSEGQFARHLCGNGHLSCVNPNHLAWGSPGDNIADANKHRKAGDNVQDRINAI